LKIIYPLVERFSPYKEALIVLHESGVEGMKLYNNTLNLPIKILIGR
jgi:hypothetical protein